MSRALTRQPIGLRFMKKTEIIESGCWLWLGYTDRKGYGIFGVSSGKTVKAHRFSYELFVGPIPEGLPLDHLCRTRNCVNPFHLEPVTNQENVIRGFRARTAKTHCKNGHELTESNTYHHPKTGWRDCRKCRKLANTKCREKAKCHAE